MILGFENIYLSIRFSAGFICNFKKVSVRFLELLELFLILMKLFNQFQQKGGEGGMYVVFV